MSCRKQWVPLLSVFVIALSIRCLYVWQIQAAPFFDLHLGDGEAYHLWARRIAGGDWLGQGVFYQAPLYPYFLALIYRILDESTLTVRLIQAFLGAVSCSLVACAGMSLFGRGGAIAGALLALYPPAIFLDALIEKSSLATLLTSALVALLAAPPERLRMTRWAGIGTILGLLALTRENALLLSVTILLWIGLATFQGPWRKRITTALLFTGGCGLILLPVGLRNLAVGGEFHLTTSQFGSNFYIGNHAGSDGTYQALVVGHGSAADEREDATNLAEQAAGRKLTPGEVSRFWTKRALEYIASHPLDWLKLTARKLALTFNASELADTESQDVYAEWSSLLRVLRPFDFGLLLGLAAFGIAITAHSWRRIWFLYAIGVTYALSTILFYVFARYRLPLVPVLLVLAAGGFVQAWSDGRRRARRLLLAAAAGGVALVLAHLPLVDSRTARATNYFSIASALSQHPERSDLAFEFYRRALDVDPQFPAARYGLGTLLTRAGRLDEAIPHFRAAVATWPDYAEAHYNLGVALAAAGRAEEAAKAYGEALRIRPADADAHIALAKTLIELKQPELAVDHYQRSLASRPKDGKALVGLGVALTQLGRVDDAIRQYQLALDADPQDASAHTSFGWTLAGQGRFAEALPHFERALALNPNDSNARRNLEQVRQILSRPR